MIQGEQGIGSRARGIALQVPSDAKFERATVALKYHYGALDLYGQDRIMSEGNSNERLAAILATKVNSLGQTFATDINRQYWLAGDGTMTTVKTGTTGTAIAVNNVQYLRRGMKITINTDTVTITNIVWNEDFSGTITVDSSITVVADETVIREGNLNNEITGVKAMVSDTGTYLGIPRATYQEWQSMVINHNAALNLTAIDRFVGRLIYENGSNPSAIYTDEETIRWLKYLYQQQGIPLEYLHINLGYKAIQYIHPKGVIPFIIEPYGPRHEMYALDESSITIRQPKPIHWMPGYDGNVWRIKEGYDVELAHLRYYSELFNDNPRTSGRFYVYTTPIS